MGQVTFIACEQEVNLGVSRSPSCQRLGLKTVAGLPGQWGMEWVRWLAG